MERSVQGKTVVIVGFGSSGSAAARLAMRQGARDVVVNDQREAADIDADKVLELAREGVRLELGSHKRETFARADLVVVSPGVPPLPVLADVERHGVPMVSEVELASWYLRSPVVAIGGTNGKSTVTTLIGEMLQAPGTEVFVGGNLGTPLSEAVDTPASRQGVVVVEVSSFQMERIHTFRPHIAVLLNVTPDHLDRYPSVAGYMAAKARMFMNQTRDDHAVVPAADPLVLSLARAGAAAVHTWGFDTGEVRLAGESILDRNGEVHPLSSLKIQGQHNVSNAMAAILAAQLAGAMTRVIRRVLETFPGLPHRMQFVIEDDGVLYFDDSKATNVGAAVQALQGFDRPVVLIAGGRDKGGSYQPLVQQLRAKGRAVVLIGEAASRIREALGGAVPCREADDMFDAVRIARSLARPGDCVLLAPACSSFDMFENYEERGKVFAAAVRGLAGSPHDREDP